MNIAFGTILIFFIVLPGLILRRTYFSGQFSKNYIKPNVSDEIVWAIIPGLIIQGLGVLLVEKMYPAQFNFKDLGILLMGSNSDNATTLAFQNLKDSLVLILTYNLSAWVIAASFGFFSQLAIRKLKLDRKLRLFRFNNEWHYLLSGEILDFKSMEGSSNNVNYVFVDALVRNDGGSTIYMGRLREYFLSKNEELDSICLTQVKRREYNGEKGVHYDMPGEFMIIPANDIINLNVRYYKDIDEEEKKENAQFIAAIIFGIITVVIILAYLVSLSQNSEDED